MSRNLIPRRAGVRTATVIGAAAGILALAAPASAGPARADVVVNPPSAPQGSGQNVHFAVTNTGQCPLGKIALIFPEDNPIAEVFPLSVDDWAPQITPMTLATPLTTIHGGTPVTQTAASITWIAMPGKALAPGRTTDLATAVGPLPATATMTFSFRTTCADGKPGPELPPATMTLTPAEPGQASGHLGGHGGDQSATGDADAAAFAALAAAAAEDDGPGFWTIAGWVIAGPALAAAGYLLLRSRRSPVPADGDEPDSGTDEDKEPVAAGAPRVTSWSYRDGPEE